MKEKRKGERMRRSLLSDYWRTEEGLFLIEAYSRNEKTQAGVANCMGISLTAFRKWINNFDDVYEAYMRGKELIDYEMEAALARVGLGATTKETKVVVETNPITKKSYTAQSVTTIKEHAPNVTAALAWLNNRKPEKWNRTKDREPGIADEDANITVTITKHGQSKKDVVIDDWDDE